MKIKCRQVQKKLNRYIDGQLNLKEKETLEHHLDGCSRCKEAYAALMQVNKLLRTLPEPEIPPSMIAKLQRIPQTGKNSIKILRLKAMLRPIPVAASILLSVFAAVTLSENLMNRNAADEVPGEYRFAQETLYTLWEEMGHE